MTSAQAVKIAQKYWEDQGECRSCSWHDFYYGQEPIGHEPDRKKLIFLCTSKDYPDECAEHRGVYIYYKDEDLLP